MPERNNYWKTQWLICQEKFVQRTP